MQGGFFPGSPRGPGALPGSPTVGRRLCNREALPWGARAVECPRRGQPCFRGALAGVVEGIPWGFCTPLGPGWVGQTAAAGAGSAGWGGGCDCGAGGGGPQPRPSGDTRYPDTRSAAAGPGGDAGRPMSHPAPPGGAAVVPLRGGGEGPPSPIPPGRESAPWPWAAASGPSFQPGGAEPGPCQRRESPAGGGGGGAGPLRSCPAGAGPARAALTSRGDPRGSSELWHGGRTSPWAPRPRSLPDPRVGRDGRAPAVPSSPAVPGDPVPGFPSAPGTTAGKPGLESRLAGTGWRRLREVAGSPRGGGDPSTPQRPRFPPLPGFGLLGRRGRAGALSPDVTATPEVTAW